MSVLTVMIMMTTTIIRTVAVAVRKGGYKEQATKWRRRGEVAEGEALIKRRRRGGAKEGKV